MRVNTDRFDPNFDFVVYKPMTLHGVSLLPGASFPKEQVPERRLRQMYHSRLIVPGVQSTPAPSQTGSAAVSSKGKKNG